MATVSYSTKAIDAEIAKCRLLCAACHALHTRKQQGYFDYGDAPSKGLSSDQLQRLSFARTIVDGLIAEHGQFFREGKPVSRPRLCDFILANIDEIKSRGS